MSDDRFTEVSTQGWFSRLGSAIKGILFGLILFIISFPILTWNEGRSVTQIKTLDEGAGSVIHIASDDVAPENDQKLVHLSAPVTTYEILHDPIFEFQANALKLRRVVQVFQWSEKTSTKKQKQLGGSEETTKTYSYSKTWSTSLINSNNFRQSQYQNPTSFPYQNRTWQAQSAYFDAFDFPPRLIEKMNRFLPVDLPSSALPYIDNITEYSGGYFIGNNPDNPQIGDVKIHFEMVEPAQVSIVAQQTGNTFQPYIASAGNEILLLEYGVAGPGEMFQSAMDSNTLVTWLIRLAGLFVMFWGLSLILKPLSIIADVIPLIGNIVEAGTNIIAFLLAILLTSLTIAVAWLVFRPLIGGALLLGCVGVIWLITSMIKAAKSSRQLARA